MKPYDVDTLEIKAQTNSRTHAGVAELADALDLGSSGRKVVEVQVLSPALYIFNIKQASRGCRTGRD
jgi:hypothetical protein